MYEKVGVVSIETIERLQEISQQAVWKTVRDNEKDFRTCYIEPDISELLERWPSRHSAFFLRIPPGGMVHKHIDVDHIWNTYHIPVQTNDECVSFMEGRPFHLQVGNIYSVNRQVEHWSVNDGDTDRVHLLMEVYE